MPAVSKKMRRAAAIAEHEPEKLHEENKGLAKMSKSDLHDYAATSEKGLPVRKRKKKPRHASSNMAFVGRSDK
jgi:hypothetical protein